MSPDTTATRPVVDFVVDVVVVVVGGGGGGVVVKESF